MKNFHIKIALAGLLICLLTTGCAGLNPKKTIVEGDQQEVNYTCKTPEGKVISTTDIHVYNDSNIEKSRVFMGHSQLRPVTIMAGNDPKLNVSGDLKPMEQEIRKQIGLQLAGKVIGQTYEMALESTIPKEIKASTRFIKIPRTRRLPKIRTASVYSFEKMLGRMPVPGDTVAIKDRKGKETNGHLKVLSVADKIVEYEIFGISHTPYPSPWGTSISRIVTENNIQWLEVRNDAETGTLVRASGVIGEIVEVNDQTITIDYGHPFAGRCLTCVVTPLKKLSRPLKTKEVQQ